MKKLSYLSLVSVEVQGYQLLFWRLISHVEKRKTDVSWKRILPLIIAH